MVWPFQILDECLDRHTLVPRKTGIPPKMSGVEVIRGCSIVHPLEEEIHPLLMET